jgi:GR25 family glycosyltransferase involved in LPS biosynthesis
MSLLQHTFYINLDHRTDRLEHVQAELYKIGVYGERFPAIKTKTGAIGCTMSHIKCIELAKKRGYDQVFICEDDITFLDPTLFLTHLNHFEENEDINWDMLIVCGNNVPPYFKIDETCIRVLNCQTTTGYIIRSHYYDTLLTNMKEGVNQLIKNPENHREFAVDIYWKRLQSQDFWYMIIPLTVTQYENHSDIENRTTNYNHLMLDLEKTWLTQPPLTQPPLTQTTTQQPPSAVHASTLNMAEILKYLDKK